MVGKNKNKKLKYGLGEKNDKPSVKGIRLKCVPQKEPYGLNLSSPTSFSENLRAQGHPGIGMLKHTDTGRCLIEVQM